MKEFPHFRLISALGNAKLRWALVTCLTICQVTSAVASLPAGWDSYTDRPKIEEVSAINHNLGSTWQSMKDGHVGLLAFLLETHQGPIYMFGRDMEYFYDFAKLATAGTADNQRLHLINVSRENVKDANLRAYLEQEGLTEERILASKNVLLLDSAYSGNIASAIKKLFSPAAQKKMKTQLLASAQPGIPSARSFLVSLNPLVNDRPPLSLNTTISAYEYLPRYTDRSSKYEYIEGRWQALGQNGVLQTDGSVSRDLALKHMQDLKADVQKPGFAQKLREKRAIVRQLKSSLTAANPQQEIQRIQTYLSKTKAESAAYAIAVIRDLHASKENSGINLKISIADLSLRSINDYAPAEMTKEYDALKAFPQWESLLDEPNSGIKRLFQNQEWMTIGNLIDADINSEINEILAKRLFDGPATGIKKKLQVVMIQKRDQAILEYLASDILSRPSADGMKDIVELVIENAAPVALDFIEKYVLTEPHFRNQPDLQAKLQARKFTPPSPKNAPVKSCVGLF